MNKENKVKIILTIACVIVCGVLYVVLGPGKSGSTESKEFTAGTRTDSSDKNDSAEKNDVGTTEKQPEKTFVYVSGAVKKPGVYTFDSSPRAVEVIEKAGGFTKKADSSAVNLASKLEDGQQLDVPVKAKSSAGSSGGTVSSGSGSASAPEQKININTADLTELTKIPGIGEAKASAIIAYRTEHGNFSTPEDIKKISGIKDGTFLKIKDFISI
ncbi:MAG: helix-hairpin-helix domain-containing protein [Eubacterium sp.]|nr:helix-hairpin-helix domain-containing protein [Eubacterium sp.]